MRKPKSLQKFGFKESHYDRPTIKWVCGKKRLGVPCEIGPDNNGNCCADFECQPKLSKDGERWQCTRSTAFGGVCTDGPLPDGVCCHPITPCNPVRSIRYKRSLVVRWVICTVFGVLLFFLGSGFKENFFSSGPLTYHHANNTDCTDCHEAANKSLSSWISSTISPENIIQSSKNCLNCHEIGDNAFQAHSLPKQELSKVSFSLDVNFSDSSDNQIACMSCHVEHHGSNNNLLMVSSQNCALCHDLPINKLRKKHPEFGQYPYPNRTGIIFDHNGHYNQYFYDKSGDNLLDSAPDNCLTCHYSDKNGIKMIVRDYQKTCSDCHNNIFEEAESFPFIEVPDLGVEPNTDLGEWPEDADGELTPFLKLLLSTDTKVTSVLSDLSLGGDDELFGLDVSDLDENEIQILAWSIKNLFYGIYKRGNTEIYSRLSRAFNCQLNAQGELIQEPACQLTLSQIDRLQSKFPYKLFCSAIKEWFPKLKIEMQLYRQLYAMQSNADLEDDAYCETNDFKEDNTDVWEEDGYSLSYLLTDHEDNFFKTWIDVSSVQLTNQLKNNIRKEIFISLNSEDSAAQCFYCHSIDGRKTENYLVHWTEEKWDPRRKGFVRFNHSEHLQHKEEGICIECHIANKESDYLETYKTDSEMKFESNFSTEKDVCETCHFDAMTEKHCQTCHNYHISGVSSNTIFDEQIGKGELKIWTEKPIYSFGEKITINFSVNRSMYVRVLRIDASGKILMLFPNEFNNEDFCKPNVTYQIPKLGSKRVLTVKPPEGVDKIIGIGSDEPISEDMLFFNEDGDLDNERMEHFFVSSTVEVKITK